LTSLVQDTSATTRANSRPKRPPKSAALEKAEQLVDEAKNPMESVLAARRVMRLTRAREDHYEKNLADWDALCGQKADKRAHKAEPPRHADHVFSTNAPEAAEACIQGYYENLFNSRGWTHDEYLCWFLATERYLSVAATAWDRIHVPMSTLLDCWRGVKNGKAPGRDGIANEVLSYFNWTTLSKLRTFFEKRLNNEAGGEVCDGWFDIDIQCLPKKKSR
jgi:hypothetical protein